MIIVELQLPRRLRGGKMLIGFRDRDIVGGTNARIRVRR